MKSSDRISMIPLLLIAVILTWPLSIRAQQNDTLSRPTLSDTLAAVKVQATRIGLKRDEVPMSVSVMDRTEASIRMQPAVKLSDLTASLPGLWVNDRENYALGERITLRGIGWRAAFGVRGIQLVLDGIPLTTADGQSISNIVDPAVIRRIEVMRGPASLFWGNSSGGVVNMSTQPAYTTDQRLHMRYLTGAYGLQKGSVEWMQSGDRLQYHAWGSYMYQDGYRVHSKTQLARAGFSGHRALTSRSGLHFMGAYAAMPEALHPGSLTKQQAEQDPRQARGYFAANDARERNFQGQLGARYYLQMDALRMETSVYGLHRLVTNPLPFAWIEVNRWAGGARWSLQDNRGALQWAAGIDTRLQHDDRLNYNTVNGERGNQLELDQLEKVLNGALFARAGWSSGPWNLSAGLRLDAIEFTADDALLADGDQSGDRTFTALSPSVGFRYNGSSWNWFANLSTSFEAPTTTELVNRPSGEGGFNPEISPEHVYGLETGLEKSWMNGRLQTDLTLFNQWVNDMLLPYQLQDSDRVYYRNEGRTRHAGVELTTLWRPVHTFSARLMYSLLHAEFIKSQQSGRVSLDGNRIPGVPRKRWAARLRWSPEPVYLSAELKGTDSYPVNNLNTYHNEGYTKVDFEVGLQRWQPASGLGFSPFVAIKNAFDADYNGSVIVNASGDRYYEPAAGRHLQFGLSVDIQ